MNDNEKIALYMGCTKGPDYSTRWLSNYGEYIDPDDFTTDYNLFVSAWNKAAEEFSETFSPELSPNLFDIGYGILERLSLRPIVFTINSRLPILLEIIDYITKVKK